MLKHDFLFWTLISWDDNVISPFRYFIYIVVESLGVDSPVKLHKYLSASALVLSYGAVSDSSHPLKDRKTGGPGSH